MFVEFWVALQFLTTFPAPTLHDLPEDAWGRSMACFPLVGLVLGGCLVIAQAVLSLLWPAPVVAALVLGLWAVLTGALHLDGLADCCDGLLVARPPEDRLRILKDTHVGTFGMVGVVVLLLVKFACLLADNGSPATLTTALFVAPVLSRWAMVYATVSYPYGRQGSSLGNTFAAHVTRRSLWVSSLLAVLSGVLLGGWFGLTALVLVWVLQYGIACWTMTRIPGLTGDVYGAINEVCEVAVLLLAVAWGA